MNDDIYDYSNEQLEKFTDLSLNERFTRRKTSKDSEISSLISNISDISTSLYDEYSSDEFNNDNRSSVSINDNDFDTVSFVDLLIKGMGAYVDDLKKMMFYLILRTAYECIKPISDQNQKKISDLIELIQTSISLLTNNDVSIEQTKYLTDLVTILNKYNHDNTDSENDDGYLCCKIEEQLKLEEDTNKIKNLNRRRSILPYIPFRDRYSCVITENLSQVPIKNSFWYDEFLPTLLRGLSLDFYADEQMSLLLETDIDSANELLDEWFNENCELYDNMENFNILPREKFIIKQCWLLSSDYLNGIEDGDLAKHVPFIDEYLGKTCVSDGEIVYHDYSRFSDLPNIETINRFC